MRESYQRNRARRHNEAKLARLAARAPEEADPERTEQASEERTQESPGTPATTPQATPSIKKRPGFFHRKADDAVGGFFGSRSRWKKELEHIDSLSEADITIEADKEREKHGVQTDVPPPPSASAPQPRNNVVSLQTRRQRQTPTQSARDATPAPRDAAPAVAPPETHPDPEPAASTETRTEANTIARYTYTKDSMKTITTADGPLQAAGTEVLDSAIVTEDFDDGDQITFFIEGKERTGTWNGTHIKEGTDNRPWGVIAILSRTGSWLRNDSKIRAAEGQTEVPPESPAETTTAEPVATQHPPTETVDQPQEAHAAELAITAEEEKPEQTTIALSEKNKEYITKLLELSSHIEKKVLPIFKKHVDLLHSFDLVHSQKIEDEILKIATRKNDAASDKPCIAQLEERRNDLLEAYRMLTTPFQNIFKELETSLNNSQITQIHITQLQEAHAEFVKVVAYLKSIPVTLHGTSETTLGLQLIIRQSTLDWRKLHKDGDNQEYLKEKENMHKIDHAYNDLKNLKPLTRDVADLEQLLQEFLKEVAETENRQIDHIVTEQGSVYRYLPNGKTQRHKTVEEKDRPPQDAIVFIPDYETLTQLLPPSFDVGETLGKNEDEYMHTLLWFLGRKMRIVNKDGNPLYTNQEIDEEHEEVYLLCGGTDKDNFRIPVSKKPQIGFSTYDTRKFVDDNGKEQRRHHIGNKVTEIKYKK